MGRWLLPVNDGFEVLSRRLAIVTLKFEFLLRACKQNLSVSPCLTRQPGGCFTRLCPPWTCGLLSLPFCLVMFCSLNSNVKTHFPKLELQWQTQTQTVWQLATRCALFHVVLCIHFAHREDKIFRWTASSVPILWGTASLDLAIFVFCSQLDYMSGAVLARFTLLRSCKWLWRHTNCENLFCTPFQEQRQALWHSNKSASPQSTTESDINPHGFGRKPFQLKV